MKLTVFNGSPRGKASNTEVLVRHFLNGFMANKENSYEKAYLTVNDNEKNFRLFQEADQILLAFPLYFSSMPAAVKMFIESLEPLCGQKGNTAIGFIVQSGFPEALHSRYLEKYLRKLAIRIGCRYSGTVIRGIGEAIRGESIGVVPGIMNRELYNSFFKLGKVFGETGKFDERIQIKLAKPEKLTKSNSWIFQIIYKIINILYWNKMLRENSAFERRFAKPYIINLI